MNALLTSHRISVDAIRADDFDAFYAARKAALLQMIEVAMGKPALSGGFVETGDGDEDEYVSHP